MQEEHEIVICLGSSCFSRNNKNTLDIIKSFLKQHGLENRVFFHGDLCSGNCEDGPVVRIDGQLFKHVSPENIHEILFDYFLSDEKES